MDKDLRYKISLQDLFTKGIKDAGAAAQAFEKNVAGIQATTKNMESSFASLRSTIIAAFSIYEVVSFGKELVKTAAEFQGFENMIKFTSLNAADAATNNTYLSKTIKDLHLDMRETYKGFAQMEAGMYGTGIEGEKLRKLFTGLSMATATLHLTTDMSGRANYAIKEIGELGTVQARQMRMLALALPGAFELAADSMGMSSSKFHKAMKKGLLHASDFLPKFGEELTKHFKSGTDAFGNSLQGKMNDVNTSLYQMKIDLEKAFDPIFLSVLTGLKNTFEFISVHGKAIKELAVFVGILTAAMGLYKAQLMLTAGWQEIVYMKNMYKTWLLVKDQIFVTNALTVAQLELNAAMKANMIGVIITAVAVLTAGIYHLIEVQKEWDDLIIGSAEGAAQIQLRKEYDKVISLITQYEKLGKTKEVAQNIAIGDEKSYIDKQIKRLESELHKFDNIGEPRGEAELKGIQRQIDKFKAFLKVLPTIRAADASRAIKTGTGETDLGSGILEPKQSRIQHIVINIIKPFENQKVSMGGGDLNIKELAPKFTEYLLSLVEDASILVSE
jgi:tape measure domain-containing protein